MALISARSALKFSTWLFQFSSRVGKEVDTLDGSDDVEGGLGVGGEPLLA
jgi:hypothetical protein